MRPLYGKTDIFYDKNTVVKICRDIGDTKNEKCSGGNTTIAGYKDNYWFGVKLRTKNFKVFVFIATSLLISAF